MFNKLVLIFLLACSFQVFANDNNFKYSEIDKRYSSVSLDSKKVENAEMQGECLVGLKALNFKKADTFDAIAEWTSYRSVSLLEQYSPCEVLIMMETAKVKLNVK